MIFRHCWECMLEVTPSRRALVLRMSMPDGVHATIVPLSMEAMTIQCLARRGSTRPPTSEETL